MGGEQNAVAAVPAGEPARLGAVQRYDILDTPRDGAFDRIAALAAQLFDVPIATVTIVDHDRIWFKATHGIDVTEVGRDPGLCASAILQSDPYVVTDAIQDPRCLDNPLVRGELGVRFYAAAPIRTPDGYNLGTVNVIAGQPRSVTATEISTLQHLADIVADELELRLTARRTVQAERHQRQRAEALTDVLQRRLLPTRPARIPGVDLATYYRPVGDELEIGGDFFDVFDIEEHRWGIAIGDVCGKGPEAAAVMGEVRSTLRAIARLSPTPATVLASLNDLLWRDGVDAEDAASSERFCTASLLCLDPTRTPVTATIANAGHPLALVRRTDGTVQSLGEPGQILGPFPDTHIGEAATSLAAGDMLLLYTDGAIEQRGVSIEVGQAALVAALASAPTSDAQAALDHIRQAIEDFLGSFDDDIALVLARVCVA